MDVRFTCISRAHPGHADQQLVSDPKSQFFEDMFLLTVMVGQTAGRIRMFCKKL